MSDTYNYDSSTRKTTGPKTTVHVGKSSLPAELTHTKEPSYVTINADGTITDSESVDCELITDDEECEDYGCSW